MGDIDIVNEFLGGNEVSGLARYRRTGEKWEDIRELVRIRDNFTCQECGKTEEEAGRALDVHHMNPFLKSEDNSMENLITLCRSCHKKADLELEKQNDKLHASKGTNKKEITV